MSHSMFVSSSFSSYIFSSVSIDLILNVPKLVSFCDFLCYNPLCGILFFNIENEFLPSLEFRGVGVGKFSTHLETISIRFKIHHDEHVGGR